MNNLWFSKKIEPYLTNISTELPTESYPPAIAGIIPTEVIASEVTTLAISGEYFSPDTLIVCPSGTINNIYFHNTQNISFDFVSAVGDTKTISVINSKGTTNLTIECIENTWTDLRLGSISEFTESHRTGTTIIRDVEGITTTGTLWSSWLRFDSLAWNRVTPNNLEVIVRYDNTGFMLGITCAAEQNESAAAQYAESQTYLYIPGNYLWGFYGTTSAQALVTGAVTSLPVTGFNFLKIKFFNNGTGGSDLSIYGLADLTNFDDVSNFIGTRTIPASFTANGAVLAPCVTMTSGQRLVALKTEVV